MIRGLEYIRLEDIKPVSVNKLYGFGRSDVYKSEEYKAFEEEMLYRLPNMETFDVEVEVNIHFYLSKNYRKSDVDNMIKAILDLLEKKEIIENDNLVKKVTAEKHDMERDVLEIVIKPIYKS